MTADTIAGKLSDTARQLLERYLWELRISLRGCRSVDPAEVEADVKQHIDQELAAEPAPVSGDKLGAVLQKLGSPWQWVPVEELTWWRRMVLRLRTGPTDVRLGAACFTLLILGLIFIPLTWPFLLASFLLARAAVAMMAEHEKELGWQRWLIYPSLVVIYLPILAILLGWPLLAGGAAQELTHSRDTNAFTGQSFRALPQVPLIIASCVAAVTAWWTILTAVTFVWPTLPMNLFRPFVGRVRRWRAMLLFVALFIATCVSASTLSDILHRKYADPSPPERRDVPRSAYESNRY